MFLSKTSDSDQPTRFSFKHVWSWLGPQRNRTFLWQVAHGRLLTNADRVARGISFDDVCPCYKEHPDTIMHVLRDCEDVKNFWSPIISQQHWSRFFSIGLHAWPEFNLSSKEVSNTYWNWPTLFGVAIRELWLDRNQLVFIGKSGFPSSIYSIIRSQVSVVEREITKSVPCFIEESLCEISVSWKAPPN